MSRREKKKKILGRGRDRKRKETKPFFVPLLLTARKGSKKEGTEHQTLKKSY